MATQALASFAEQLASWGRQAISLGRSPFRKVETDLSLLTRAGELRAPLVFWINRDSFMAGGLLLFPRQTPAEALEQGGLLAEALGLRQFVTWSAQEATVWQMAGDTPRCHSSTPLPGEVDQVESFHKLLLTIMDELKLLSVMAAPTPADLSAYYLANLCRETVRDSLEDLATQRRISWQQGSRTSRNETPETWALGKAHLSLFRLLALLSHDRLPPNIQPEGLERALRFALPGLPDELGRPLQFTTTDLALPDSVAVRFHHLFRRLLQLDLPGQPDRTADCCQLLMQTASAQLLEGVALEPITLPPGSGLTLEVNLPAPAAPAEALIEVAPPPLLAGRALERCLRGERPARLQEPDLWRLDAGLPVQRVQGQLGSSRRPPREQRLQMETTLRRTWPTRRFQLAGDTPEWLFQALHLLGFCRPGGELQLSLPDTWLFSAWGEPLWETLCADFSFQEVTLLASSRLQLQLRRGVAGGPVSILGQVAGRLDPEQLRRNPRQLLGYRLHLPGPWVALLDAELLVAPGTPPDHRERQALQLFFLSAPGRELAAWAGLTDFSGEDGELDDLLSRQVPVPHRDRLNRLTHLLTDASAPSPPPDSRELLDWLGAEFRDLPPLGAENRRVDGLPGGERQRGSRTLQRQLSDEVFIDGIPCFPEHYLYDHYRPELSHYQWQGKLQRDATFFGQVRLSDATGRVLEVASEALACGLLLIDRSGRQQAALPADPQLAEAILLRYLKDLHKLHERLNLLACRQGQDPRAVTRLVRRVWESQPLPPWEEVRHTASFFSLPGFVE